MRRWFRRSRATPEETAAPEQPPIRVERRYDHPIDRVWRAVTAPDEMAQWFPAVPDWTPELGETFTGAVGATGEITELEAPTRFAWVFGVEHFRFELEPDDAGCRLVFTHVFDSELAPREQLESGWDAYFKRLDAHLAGGHLSEEDAHAAP